MSDVLKQRQKQNLKTSILEKQQAINANNSLVSALNAEIAVYRKDLAKVRKNINSLSSEVDSILTVHSAYEKNKLKNGNLLKGKRVENDIQGSKKTLETYSYQKITDVQQMALLGEEVEKKIEEKISSCESSIRICQSMISIASGDIESLNRQLTLVDI